MCNYIKLNEFTLAYNSHSWVLFDSSDLAMRKVLNQVFRELKREGNTRRSEELYMLQS